MEFQQGYLNIESHKMRYAQPWQTIPWKHYLNKTDIRISFGLGLNINLAHFL